MPRGAVGERCHINPLLSWSEMDKQHRKSQLGSRTVVDGNRRIKQDDNRMQEGEVGCTGDTPTVKETGDMS